jgi:rsbT co-antagonist protein RsbR
MDESMEILARVIDTSGTAVLERWRASLVESGATAGGRIPEAELQKQCRDILMAIGDAVRAGARQITDSGFAAARAILDDISRSRALQGFSPRETATLIFSLKEPLFEQFRSQLGGNAALLAQASLQMTLLIDQLGLYTMEVYQRSREDVVRRQQDEIAELSTPVVKLWDGILALPIIGTLDSARTQVVMENLLQAIVEHSAELAIIDITGVPTVDTLVAQHLLKTIAAARLMGGDCIVSGIRPQIAQTMVHLGVDLNVVSKATLADALALAFQRTGRSVIRKARTSG